MSRSQFLSWLLVFASGLTAQDPSPSPGSDPSIEPIRQRVALAVQKGEVPSAALVLVRGGRIAHSEAFGEAERATKRPATLDSVYLLASISKPITATALMIAVERGLLDLDRPVNRYLKAPGLRSFRGPADAITLRRLANHTAGLPTHWNFFYPGTRPPEIEESIRRYGFASTPPGRLHVYSNFGFGVLGHAVERASKTPWADFVARELFVPLDMTRSSDRVREEDRGHSAIPYVKDAAGEFQPVAYYEFDHPGASAFRTSARDLARFLLLHLNDGELDGKRILSAASARAMRTKSAESEAISSFGIGWRVDTVRGQESFSHTGSMPGVATLTRGFPATGDGLVILANAAQNTLCADVDRLAADWFFPGVSSREPDRAAGSTPVPPDPSGWHGTWVGRIFHPNGPIDMSLMIRPKDRASLRLGANTSEIPLRQVSLESTRLVARAPLLLSTPAAYFGLPEFEFRLTLEGDHAIGTATAQVPNWFNLPHHIELRRVWMMDDSSKEAEERRTPLTPARGHLVIVGGGGTVDSILTRALELAGGATAKVVVLPQASARANAGQASVERWRTLGAGEVRLLSLDNPKEDRAHVAAANLIWMPGGAQSRLMDALRQAGLVDLIAARFHEGAVVGGTSAGAAVMSGIMIASSEEGPNETRIPAVATGIGLLPSAIVDQHFTQRNRLPRLRLACAQHPNRFGIGIDERTALLVSPDRATVLGEGTITLLVPSAASDALLSSPSVFRPGDSFDLSGW